MAAFQDTYEAHFGAEPPILTEISRESVDKRAWTSSNSSLSRLGTVIESFPAGTSKPELSKESSVSLEALDHSA